MQEETKTPTQDPTNFQSHDGYFKACFGQLETARSFFKAYLGPEIKAMADWDSLEKLPTEFVDQALKHHLSDLVFKVKIVGIELFLYIHFEHQRKVVPEMSFRTLGATVDLWRELETFRKRQNRRLRKRRKNRKKEEVIPPDAPFFLPPVLPLVLYQGGAPWNAELSLHEMLKVPQFMRRYTPQIHYLLIDLNNYSNDEIQGNEEVELSLLLLKNIDSPELMRLLKERLLPLLQQLLNQGKALEPLKSMLYYMLYKATHLNKDEAVQLFQSIPTKHPNIEETVMTFAEQCIQQGMEKGMEKGMERGLIMALETKFGTLPSAILQRIRQLKTDQFDPMFKKVITCNRIEDIFPPQAQDSTP